MLYTLLYRVRQLLYPNVPFLAYRGYKVYRGYSPYPPSTIQQPLNRNNPPKINTTLSPLSAPTSDSGHQTGHTSAGSNEGYQTWGKGARFASVPVGHNYDPVKGENNSSGRGGSESGSGSMWYAAVTDKSSRVPDIGTSILCVYICSSGVEICRLYTYEGI